MRLRTFSFAVLVLMLLGSAPMPSVDSLAANESLRSYEEHRQAERAAYLAEVARFQGRTSLHTQEVERRAAEHAAWHEAQRQAEVEAAAKKSSTPAVSSSSVWDRLAQCESNGNWSINTGNGYYGGLQFSLGSWQAVGGTGYPHQHSREVQIAMGERLLKMQGWGAWPACSRKLGLR